MSLDNKLILQQSFSQLNMQQRFKYLMDLGVLTEDSMRYLYNGGMKNFDLSEKLIENSIGYFQIPLGVATNFRIDEKDYIIPMAVEETSIIAALSKTAKWVKQHGTITTEVIGNVIIGQIQLSHVKDFQRFAYFFKHNRQHLIDLVNNSIAASMVQRGGGVTDLTLRHIMRDDYETMGVIHVMLDACDAMGANLMNQILEFLKKPIEELSKEKVTMCILSNLNDQKITKARVTINDVDPLLGYSLQEASIFAHLDPYRAATHNKGVMNGIDPVLIATGNDWRAVEAAIHAFASRNGQYQAITSWHFNDDKNVLTGEINAPIIVGTVGGVTRVHPTAKICLDMMNITSANELSRVIATVGLLQNLGALRALCTEGIVKGHMRLHINNIMLAVETKPHEEDQLRRHLEKYLHENHCVSIKEAQNFIDELRTNNAKNDEYHRKEAL